MTDLLLSSSASATLAVFNALPTSLRDLALQNPLALVTALQSEFATGVPAWFSSIPTDVQSYFLTQGDELGLTTPTSLPADASALPTDASAALSSAGAAASSAAADVSAAASSALAGASSRASSAAAAATSSSSSGGAALPTQVVAGGFAGVAGLMAILAL